MISNTKRTVAVFLSLMLLSAGTVTAQTDDVQESVSVPTREIIVAVTGGRVRSQPNLKGEILLESALGTRFTAISETGGWDQIKLKAKEGEGEGKTGWISRSITQAYDSAKPGIQAQKIAAKYFAQDKMSFQTAKQLFEYLPGAADDAKTFEIGGDLRLKSLMALSDALKAVPFGKADTAPYKEFLAKNKEAVAYSEPAGEWYVRSEEFWQLHTRYKKFKVGEQIAWQAASNPLPGECEGYINCYLYLLRVTQGEYLNFYPNGKYSKQSIENIYGMLDPIVSDIGSKSVYFTTNDISDRAEFNKMLSELRKIVSRTPFIEKQTVLSQILRIAEGFR